MRLVNGGTDGTGRDKNAAVDERFDESFLDNFSVQFLQRRRRRRLRRHNK